MYKCPLKTIALLFIVFSCLQSYAKEPAEASGLKESIDSIAAIYLAKSPGKIIFVGINVQGVEQVFYYNASNDNGNSVADSGSLFEIGPLSGTFTSILFSKMTLQGAIGYDDAVQKYLPFNVTAPVYQKIVCKPLRDGGASIGLQDEPSVRFSPYVCLPDVNSVPQPILLCYLSTHTSGLPDYPFNMRSITGEMAIYENYSKENLYDFLKGFRLVEPISYTYNYSELGLALLGHVLELRSDMPFDMLLSDGIFKSLGMNSTLFVKKGYQNNLLLNGYTSSSKIAHRRYFDLFAPAGGLNSTIGDMMIFLSANLGNTNPEFKNVLDYTHNPRIHLSGEGGDDIEIAMGWKLSKINDNGDKVVWQGGTTEGFASFMGFEEIKKKGVVILSNSSESVEALAFDVLKLIEK